MKTWQPIWSYLAICKINECFCEYLALQLAQTNGFFPSWTASMWFNKLRFDEKQLTHWSHLKGVSCKYHGRFMVSWKTRKSISKSVFYTYWKPKSSSNFGIGAEVLFLKLFFFSNFFNFSHVFPLFEKFVVEQRSKKLI